VESSRQATTSIFRWVALADGPRRRSVQTGDVDRRTGAEHAFVVAGAVPTVGVRARRRLCRCAALDAVAGTIDEIVGTSSTVIGDASGGGMSRARLTEAGIQKAEDGLHRRKAGWRQNDRGYVGRAGSEAGEIGALARQRDDVVATSRSERAQLVPEQAVLLTSGPCQ